MTDLHVAIRERLDELDAAARSAMTYTTGEWDLMTRCWVDTKPRDLPIDGGGVIKGDGWDSVFQTGDDRFVAEHIVAFRPPVALSITAAIRAVLDLHKLEDSEYTDADGQSRASTDCATCDTGGVPDGWPCPTTLAIAEKLGIKT